MTEESRPSSIRNRRALNGRQTESNRELGGHVTMTVREALSATNRLVRVLFRKRIQAQCRAETEYRPEAHTRVRSLALGDLFHQADGSDREIKVFLAECEICGFTAMSRNEQDAVGVVERHKCSARSDEEAA